MISVDMEDVGGTSTCSKEIIIRMYSRFTIWESGWDLRRHFITRDRRDNLTPARIKCGGHDCEILRPELWALGLLTAIGDFAVAPR